MEFDSAKNRLMLDSGDMHRLPRGIKAASELTTVEAIDLVFRLNERRSEIDQIAQRSYFKGRIDMTLAGKRQVTELGVFSANISNAISLALEREFDKITTDDLKKRD